MQPNYLLSITLDSKYEVMHESHLRMATLRFSPSEGCQGFRNTNVVGAAISNRSAYRDRVYKNRSVRPKVSLGGHRVPVVLRETNASGTALSSNGLSARHCFSRQCGSNDARNDGRCVRRRKGLRLVGREFLRLEDHKAGGVRIPNSNPRSSGYLRLERRL